MRRLPGFIVTSRADMDLSQSLELLDVLPDLTKRWCDQLSEPHRHYHTLRHVQHMLAHMPQDAATGELIAAIWLHDIVYDPRAADNEERSADQAEQDLAGSGLDLSLVRDLIMVTKKHAPTSVPGLDLMSDLDLTILGEKPLRYKEYAAQIRLEYGHVPEADYRRGRAAILHHLDRKSVV